LFVVLPTPDIGMPFNTPPIILPYISDELLISGKMCCGMSKNLNKRSV
jgi:hypothetical protein